MTMIVSLRSILLPYMALHLHAQVRSIIETDTHSSSSNCPDHLASAWGDGTEPSYSATGSFTYVFTEAIGAWHVTMGRPDRRVGIWRNDYGQLGNRTTTDPLVPGPIEGHCALATHAPLPTDQTPGALFPNPSNGNFMVPVDPRTKMVSISVVDAAGRTVFAQQRPAINGQVAVSASDVLTSGIYRVHITNGPAVSEQWLFVLHF